MYYYPVDIVNALKCAKDQKQVKSLPKLSQSNIERIKKLTDLFNTKWSNVNPYVYMLVGTSLWKTFSYTKILNKKILKEYIRKDKAFKRKDVGRNEIEDSFKWLKTHGIKSLDVYKDNGNTISLAVIDYLNNNIDKVLMTYLIINKYIPENYINVGHLGHIYNNLKHSKRKAKEYSRLIKRLEEKL